MDRLDYLRLIRTEVLNGNEKTAKKYVLEALEEGLGTDRIIEDGLIAGMREVGIKFKNEELYVPDVLVAARAIGRCTELLEKRITREEEEFKGTVVIGTVHMDLHDIGKNMVIMMMRSRGLKVIDLGVDVPAARFMEAAQAYDADIIACSALLTTTKTELRAIVQEIKNSDLKNRVKIMVGGAPIDAMFSKAIGADYYTSDAITAGEVAYSYCIAKYAAAMKEEVR